MVFSRNFLFGFLFSAIALSSSSPPLFSLESYQVSIEGLDDPDVEELVCSTAQLYLSLERPPASLAALRRRAEADIPRITQALQNYAYYNPTISIDVSEDEDQPSVLISIDPGPIFTLGSIEVEADNETDYECDTIKYKYLGLALDSPAYPEDILAAETLLLALLERESYPLAFIKDREIFVDLATCQVYVIFHVDTGPFCTFGPTTLSGNCSVYDLFFYRKIWWNRGCPYDPCLINRTIRDLESSGLFNSIAIVNAEELDENGQLPMEIVVDEGRQRSYALGVSYATQLGPGVLGEWEHRNMRGLGERLTTKAHIRQRLKEAKFLYVKPDFCMPQQDLVWLGELQHEKTTGFTESYFSFSGTIERQLNDETRISYGLMYKHLLTSHSDHNGHYNLIKAPMQFRWSHIDNLLDPTKGSTLTFKTIPSWQVIHPQFTYNINTLTATHYKPLRRNRSIVFATRLFAGTILGAARRTIPSSELFYAGSENTLRGYRYLTVSPLDADYKPVGGRSICVFSSEMRFRLSDCWGFAIFYDIGNVYDKPLPEFDQKQLQAAGFGVRYHTPVGPLRLDFAFPLNPRPHMHDHLQIYMSIGQAF